MASTRHATYASGESEGQIESLSQKLLDRTRKQIREMDNHAVMSPKWLEMAQNLSKIGKICDAESQIDVDKKEATLWDGNENVLRFILEDGKLNQMLRTMVEFKTVQRKEGCLPNPDVCRMFETGLGIIFKHMFAHLEALQTTDLPLLLEHIITCLARADVCGEYETNSLPPQEVMCIFYLEAFLVRLYSLNYQPLIKQMISANIVELVVNFVVHFKASLSATELETALHVLSLICDLDEFEHDEETRSSFLPSEDAERTLCSIRGLVNGVAEDGYEKRKKLRPLLTLMETLDQNNERK